MAGQLDGVRAKIGRAKVHLDDAEGHCIAVSMACEDALVSEYDHKRAEYVFRLERVPPVPLDIPLILGDAIHNLRSALDHLAWVVVVSEGGTPNRDTTFPILGKRLARDRRPDIPPGVSDEVREVLHLLQPYQGGGPTNHPLSILRELNVRDKHRELLVTLLGALDAVILGTSVDVTYFDPGPYEDGDEVLRLQWRPLWSNSEAEPEPHISFGVVLGEDRLPASQVEFAPSDFIRATSVRYIEQEVVPGLEPFI